MTAEIRKLIQTAPFIPFTIHTADGGKLRIPTVDHVAVQPKGNRVIVFGEDEDFSVLSPILISRVTVDKEPPQENL